MKAGDKIFCIKSNDTHTENKTYEILKIDANSIKISANSENDFQTFRWYYLYEKYSLWYDFNDFFMSKNKYRKTKIQKLNDNR